MGILPSLNEILATKEENNPPGMADVSAVDITRFSKAHSQTRYVHHQKLKTIMEESQPYIPLVECNAFEKNWGIINY